ncbi:unnamed protein product [Adineta steineri]|uniref:G-protein coupled receptors family 1 profile domain-containing protein n=1 Tax=Adineta steineri TaxID=433720 RepID=A0A818S403_9BILA|nr:unnamed protein product [Adineta steineri]
MINKNIIISNTIINWTTLYIPLLTIIVGTLGSICNIITFSSKKLRYNSCAFYFLCSTIFDLIYLLFSSITRFMSDHYVNFLSNGPFLYCKCRTYLVVVMPILSSGFLMFASIDRFLSTSSSRKWRNFSKIHVAWRVSIITFVLVILSTSHVFFLFELQLKDINNKIYECVPHPGIYRIFVSIYLFLSSPFVVYTIMFICTISTCIRIRALRYRIKHLQYHRNKHRNLDRHLLTIIFVQIGLGMLLTITNELFLDKLSLVVYYLNFAKSFPVNTLTSPLFRQVFHEQINKLFKYICVFCIRKDQSTANRITIQRRN